MHPIVIVGSGLAGYTLLKEIRKRDTSTPVTLVTADDGVFYSKPNLSNALAAGRSATALAGASAQKMAADQQATVLTHTRVTAIDTQNQRVQTGSGALDYGKLVLALGADPIPHGLSGNGTAAVLAVNDLADYAVFRDALDGKKRVTVLGGGLIGCEFANDLVHAGFTVDVVHLGAWPLERLLPVEAGRRLADGLAALGVTWHFGRTGRSVESADAGYRVTLDNGDMLAADVVLSAIGLRPRTQLAQAAGIPVGRGIQTGRLLETGAPNVYALGDCAEVEGQNLPYVQPLMVQARALAATLTGTPTPVVYPAMPVMVKTPAHPVAVLPPRLGASGGWKVECGDTGICALHVDDNGRLQGFALTGSETGRRNTLVKELAA
ncbi:FAD-dependent oxidoreductase [Thiobacillus sp.]|uniref:FAD-dependent oxidoreductase n=1 Tax=Thiobacillus sp. TaxID=924 RepID=UPI00180C625A|nr:FAD-dependent oxidoreductase [Thiobacillus sp.]MBC2730465.1 FAD-dependent oxidoreductase [Thiobacillus sp.]MBC2739203.1 FAD-dependent oxidoreductase [Thiobacillus sp.]MBC2760511.1 FAD-dependent oxidoreductase [Thiobacillus sp.]